MCTTTRWLWVALGAVRSADASVNAEIVSVAFGCQRGLKKKTELPFHRPLAIDTRLAKAKSFKKDSELKDKKKTFKEGKVLKNYFSDFN